MNIFAVECLDLFLHAHNIDLLLRQNLMYILHRQLRVYVKGPGLGSRRSQILLVMENFALLIGFGTGSSQGVVRFRSG